MDRKTVLKLLEETFTIGKRRMLSSHLRTLNQLDQEIEKIERAIQDANENPERKKMIMILRSIPGIEWLAASIILAEIGNIAAFSSAKKLSSYAGLVPTISQSGKRKVEGQWKLNEIHGHPSVNCNHNLKWIMVLGANAVIKAKETDVNRNLKQFHNRIQKRHKGKYGKLTAKLALAHKLLKLVWTLLTRNEYYKGHQNSMKAVRPLKKVRKQENEIDPELSLVPLLQKASVYLAENKPGPEKECLKGEELKLTRQKESSV